MQCRMRIHEDGILTLWLSRTGVFGLKCVAEVEALGDGCYLAAEVGVLCPEQLHLPSQRCHQRLMWVHLHFPQSLRAVLCDHLSHACNAMHAPALKPTSLTCLALKDFKTSACHALLLSTLKNNECYAETLHFLPHCTTKLQNSHAVREFIELQTDPNSSVTLSC